MTTMPSAQTNDVRWAAQRFVDAQRILESVKAQVAEAKDALILMANTVGVESIDLPDAKVAVVDAERRSVDADALADRITASLFDGVTKRSVVLDKFDAAVELGQIDSETIAAVVTATPYTAVRVTKK